jgi:predicted N-acyltransferase
VPVDLSLHESITDIPKDEWDRLLGDGPPFLSWDFLQILEQTGCVKPERGWAPAHISLTQNGQRVGVAPAYIKGNSEGEFVFDHHWADFSERRLGAQYYPKLVVASPFTPATGPRLLLAPQLDLELGAQALVRGLEQVVADNPLSSAHVLFAEPAQALALGAAGMLLRQGVQFHWHNAGYFSFDDFLGRYSSKRRHQVRRERRELEAQGIELTVKSGKELRVADIDHMFEFYCATVEKHFYGRRYLNREFFHELCSRMGEHVLVVLAHERGVARPLAGAFNLLGKHKLYGRYWGAREERRFLHFNVCYYRGIEECILRGLDVFEPGAGGEHKVVRGFEPTITYSAHHLKHPSLERALRDFLQREKSAIDTELEEVKPVLRPLDQDEG